MRRLAGVVSALALTTWCVLVPAARADQAAVTIGDLFYAPPTIDVQIGDTVVWTNKDTSPLRTPVHTVTSYDGSFASPDLRPNDTFAQVFSKKGEYAYYCKYYNMSGRVRVLAAGQSPGPTAGASPGASPTPTASPSVVIRTILPPSPTAAPSPSPSPRPSPSPSPSPTPTPSPSPSATSSETPESSPPPGGGSSAPLIVAIVGLVVAAGAGGGLLWLRRRPPGAPPPGGGPP